MSFDIYRHGCTRQANSACQYVHSDQSAVLDLRIENLSSAYTVVLFVTFHTFRSDGDLYSACREIHPKTFIQQRRTILAPLT